MDLLDINLNGCIYFARIALAYLHAGSDNSQLPSKCLTLISSAAAFQEAPGMPGYAASKVGILGLMRSIRSLAPKMCNTRVNVIAPWATDTAMVEGHTRLFTENNIPLQSPDDVAVFTQYVTADPVINGKTVYVGAARGFDIEEGLDRTLPQWLGQVNADLWKRQARAFAKVNPRWLHAQGLRYANMSLFRETGCEVTRSVMLVTNSSLSDVEARKDVDSSCLGAIL
jgi:hypothetical protein